VAVRYSDDPVTNAAIHAVVEHPAMFSRCCELARQARDGGRESAGNAAPGWPGPADLDEYVGVKIATEYGAEIAGLMTGDIWWSQLGTEVLKTITAEAGQ
jgi:hypothetical protein